MGARSAAGRPLHAGRSRALSRDPRRSPAVSAGLLVLLVFFALPILYFFARALADRSLQELLGIAADILSRGETRRVILFTVGQATLTAVISLVVALPGAYLLSHYRFPLRRLLYSLSLLPFVLPSIIVVVCMISFYGRNGLVNRLLPGDLNLVYNFGGIILAHVFYNFSLALRIIADGWAGIDRRYAEVSNSLGDRGFSLFRRVTLPLLTPSIISAFLLVFIYSFLSFGIVLVFGGIQFSTFEVKIFEEMNVNLDLAAASVYALLQLLFSFAFIFAVARGVAGTATEREQITAGSGLRPLGSLPLALRVAAGAYLVGIVLFLLGPIFTMILRAFSTESGLGLENFRELFVPGASPRDIAAVIRSSVAGVIVRSVLVALTSGLGTMLLTVPIVLALRGRRTPFLDSVFQVPIGVSFVTLAIGLRLLYGGLLPPLLLVVAGQVFVAFPIVFRILRSAVDELREHYVESAAALGAKGLRLSRDITLPLLRRPLLNAFAYSLAIAFADLTIVLTVGAGRVTTFPVAIYRLIGFRSFDVALALGVVYLAICLLLFRIIDSTSR